MLTSNLQFLSLGTVAKDKELDSDTIEVYLDEIHPHHEGIVDPSPSPLGNASVGITIQATWRPSGDARITAPDVVTGERVSVYRYADSDAYYWMSEGKNLTLRKTEHVVLIFTNSENNDEPATPKNSLIITLSTRDKYIRLTTPTNRGEKAGYDLMIDYGEGYISLGDTLRTKLTIDSVAEHVTLTTSKVTLDVDKLHVKGVSEFDQAVTMQDALVVKSNVSFLSALAVAGIATVKGLLSKSFVFGKNLKEK